MNNENFIDDKFKEIIQSNTGCVMIMAGSDSDEPHIGKIAKSLDEFAIPYRVKILSAHKNAAKLEEGILYLNNLGGILGYAGVAGGTDALSGILGFNALGPVITCPPDTSYANKEKYTNKFNESCLTNPHGSSNAYISRPGNVGRFFAQTFSGLNVRIKQALTNSIEIKLIDLKTKGKKVENIYNIK